jgi:hypothetical protein
MPKNEKIENTEVQENTNTVKMNEVYTTKLTESLNAIQNITLALGQLEVQKLDLDDKKNKLTTELMLIRENQSALTQEILNKYGEGEIRLETQEFIKKTK